MFLLRLIRLLSWSIGMQGESGKIMSFAITIFLSAFFLFQVQPVIARYILPWYGGTPAVWSTCMMFFQVGLLVGYVYAHLLARYVKVQNQVFLHAALLVLSLIFLPITPDSALKPSGDGDPIWGITRLLILTVGVPYVLISSTGPLLQHWYNLRFAGRSPYRLYALSNLASLLGLLTYPFLIEPRIALGAQTVLWSCGYLAFAGVCIWSGRSLLSAKNIVFPGTDSENGHISRLKTFTPLIWVGFSACGSIILLAVTSKITQDISVIPFLWALPLSLYLCTFIIAFDSPKWYRREIWIPAFLLSSGVITCLLQSRDNLNIVMTIVLYSAAMFCIVMVCHGELVRSKPMPDRLTFFYLMVALGGALGGVFVNFVATNIFPAYWELHAGIGLSLILVGISLFSSCSQRPGIRQSALGAGWSIVTIALILLLVNAVFKSEGDALTTRRNFYGVLRVHEQGEGTRSYRRKLYSGQINHGLQLFHPEKRGRILSYYSAHSGIGIAFRRHPKRLALHSKSSTKTEDLNLHVGTVGLGIGVISLWGRPGDTFRFYEINPEVVSLADEFFTVLKDSKAKIEMVTGDGRISLERELQEQGSMLFDILAVDAFSADAIPVHLITREAVELYFKHLRADGILALHITNRHLDLRPVVYGLSREMGIEALMVIKKGQPRDFIKGSTWILLTKNKSFLKHPRVLKYVTSWPDNIRDDIIWTDDYSSLLKVLK